MQDVYNTLCMPNEGDGEEGADGETTTPTNATDMTPEEILEMVNGGMMPDENGNWVPMDESTDMDEDMEGMSTAGLEIALARFVKVCRAIEMFHD